MLQLQSLSKSYGSNHVLRGLDASFAAGQVYGIIGENGAGKTTLFRCIAGLHTYHGSVIGPRENFLHRLGFLQTKNYFFPKMTGREYLRFLCQARKVAASDLDGKNVFDLPLDDYAETYSTGMQKKLALLGVLLQQNEILILDEPFNGVDIQSNILITAIIRELKAKDKIVLISSHIFSTLSDTCDEIYLLREGLFARKVLPAEYSDLEQAMEDVTIGNRVDRLQL